MTNSSFFSLAFGIGTKNTQDSWLEVYYPAPLLNPDAALVTAISSATDYKGGNQALNLSTDQLESIAAAIDSAAPEQAQIVRGMASSTQPLVLTMLETDTALSSTPEAYLKLHLLSHRLVKPHDLDLAGIFPTLPNVAWTNQGAIDLSELPQRQMQARLKGELLEVSCVDKFPKMTNYVVPTGVRIAHTARVRLGAYIGEGTTVMHEGFVNFNAGTMGESMIEGRVSAGVVVNSGSDLGGSASIIGTLSGGNNIVISVGEGCLIGANAGLGIPLGDRCTIEAGLYLTAGAKVSVLDSKNQFVEVVKARELANKPDLLFIRNSQSGTIECRTNKSAIELNAELHAHN
ncbi:MAG: 2,3,4,5-tetrahydropyridine-2,6-dicarboxylate N-succinyltransferase [Pseudomonadales bacterium]|nr:2,3,4,5-tetrahydropyridine-2,6-dicarboxylate N-succinyltransferase [Pseudomonadales bacterium]